MCPIRGPARVPLPRLAPRLAPLLAPLLLLAALAGCAGPRGGPGGENAGGAYLGGPVPFTCVPFARALSGIDLAGNAASWWDAAPGRYRRARHPRAGAVLVLRATPRLPEGHLAVVTRVLGPRAILVAQANWVARRVTVDQAVVDVSGANDWSLVRVWWPPSGQLGRRRYPADGFILPPRPRSPERLEAGAPRAVRLALRGSGG